MGSAHALLPFPREIPGTITVSYRGYSSTNTHWLMPGETDKVLICKTEEQRGKKQQSTSLLLEKQCKMTAHWKVGDRTKTTLDKQAYICSSSLKPLGYPRWMKTCLRIGLMLAQKPDTARMHSGAF